MTERAVRWVIATATLAKLTLAALTLGSNDMAFFRHFGWEIVQHGLAHEYRFDPLFNHTPLVGGYMVLITLLAAGSEAVFAFLVRLPGIVADAQVALALLGRCRTSQERVWVGAFALSPTALMVTGFHGNVDAVLAAALFFAAAECERGRVARSAFWLGMACQVKVAALLVAPVYFFHWIARGEGKRFFGVAAAVVLLGWSPALLTCPVEFMRQALGYAGYWGIWGITWLMKSTGIAEFQTIGSAVHSPVAMGLMQGLKFSILAGTVLLAWGRRRGDVWLTLALAWAVFMTFASGVAAQYLVWPIAVLFVAAPRCWAIVEIGQGIFLAVFYTALCGGLPWYYGEANAIVNERWLPWTVVAWIPWVAVAGYLTLRVTRRESCLSQACR